MICDTSNNDWKELMKDQDSISKGPVKYNIYGKYYDVTKTILTAASGALNSIDQDSNLYQSENVHDSLQRNGDVVHLINDGTDYLYARVSQGGSQKFSQENIIYPGDTKDYYNVYELRLRSPTAGLPYRFSEHEISRTCCPESITTIVKATLQNTNLPVANSNFLITDIVPTNPPSLMLVEAAISITGILSATIMNGGNTQTVFFNSGTALVANSLYIFGVILHSGDTMNIRYSVTGGVIQVLRIDQTGEVV